MRVWRGVGASVSSGVPGREHGVRRSLSDAVGVENVIQGPAGIAAYARNITTAPSRAGAPFTVVLPATLDETAEVAEIARREVWDVATCAPGLALRRDRDRDAEPRRPLLAVGHHRMRSIGVPSRIDRTVTAGAGTTIAEISAALSGSDFRLPFIVASAGTTSLAAIVAGACGPVSPWRQVGPAQILSRVDGVLTSGEIATLSATSGAAGGFDTLGLLARSRDVFIMNSGAAWLEPRPAAERSALVAFKSRDQALTACAQFMSEYDAVRWPQFVFDRVVLRKAARHGWPPALANYPVAVAVLFDTLPDEVDGAMQLWRRLAAGCAGTEIELPQTGRGLLETLETLSAEPGLGPHRATVDVAVPLPALHETLTNTDAVCREFKMTSASRLLLPDARIRFVLAPGGEPSTTGTRLGDGVVELVSRITAVGGGLVRFAFQGPGAAAVDAALTAYVWPSDHPIPDLLVEGGR